jgi:hypothetical protein
MCVSIDLLGSPDKKHARESQDCQVPLPIYAPINLIEQFESPGSLVHPGELRPPDKKKPGITSRFITSWKPWKSRRSEAIPAPVFLPLGE